MNVKTTQLLAAALTTTLIAGTASAVTSNLTLTNESDTIPTLNTSGTILYAYNLGSGTNVNGSDPSDTSVHQSITFTNIATTSNHTTSAGTVDLSLYAGDAADAINIATTSSNHFGSASGLGTEPAGSFIYANASDQAIEISGLDAGKQYLVQFLFGDNRSDSWADWNLNVIVDDVDSGENLVYNTDDSGVNGIYAAASIEVTGQTALDFELQADSGAGPGFSAIVVSEVPEPSSLALLGLGGLMIARRRRG